MIILMAYFIGIILQTLLNIPIPGTVLGLIILFIALYTGVIKAEMIEDICDKLLSHMSFLFVPAGVGLVTSFGILNGKWIDLMVILVISTGVVWSVTAFVVKFLRRA